MSGLLEQARTIACGFIRWALHLDSHSCLATTLWSGHRYSCLKTGSGDTEKKVIGPRRRGVLRRRLPGKDSGLLDHILLVPWLLYCGHGKGHMLDLSVGQVTSFMKSELKTDPPFGVNIGAKILLCKSQDIC